MSVSNQEKGRRFEKLFHAPDKLRGLVAIDDAVIE
jgi:hypothetical protein